MLTNWSVSTIRPQGGAKCNHHHLWISRRDIQSSSIPKDWCGGTSASAMATNAALALWSSRQLSWGHLWRHSSHYSWRACETETHLACDRSFAAAEHDKEMNRCKSEDLSRQWRSPQFVTDLRQITRFFSFTSHLTSPPQKSGQVPESGERTYQWCNKSKSCHTKLS